MSSELRRLWEQAGGKLPGEWKIVSLESLLRDSKSIAVGVMYPGPDTHGGIPLIKVGDIKDGTVAVKPSYCISDKINEEHKRTQLTGDELLITLVGNPGECVVVTHSMSGWNPARAIATIRLKEPNLRIYLKTVLESIASKHLIDAVLNTTVQKTLNLKDIRKLPIPFPPQYVIQDISEIANALTNRIALLRETNATLEAIAQALFKSWFVDFDPVRAKREGREPEGMDTDTAALFPDSFEESEPGLLPKGWRMGVLGDIADTVRKQISPSELHSELYYVGLEHMPRHSLSLYSWDNADGLESAKAAFRPGDILFGKLRPYFHKVVIAPFAGVCSTDILVCRSKQTAFYGVILMHLFSVKLIEYASRLSNGAKMPRINWKDIAAYSICISPSIIADKYSKAVDPLFASMIANAYRIQTLASIRDTLLPRLISGQLRLPEAQALTEETTA